MFRASIAKPPARVRDILKKRKGLDRVAVLEPPVMDLILFGENDVRPHHFQRGRIGGPGRGFGKGNVAWNCS